KPVVSREEIMALEKLHGYWKYRDLVVPFRFEARIWPVRTERFIARKAMLVDAGPEGNAPIKEAKSSDDVQSRKTYKFVRKVAKSDDASVNKQEPRLLRKTKAEPGIILGRGTEQLAEDAETIEEKSDKAIERTTGGIGMEADMEV